MDIEKIKKQAMEELKEEKFRKEVEKYKQKLKERRTLWEKLFPFKIIIIRRNQ